MHVDDTIINTETIAKKKFWPREGTKSVWLRIWAWISLGSSVKRNGRIRLGLSGPVPAVTVSLAIRLARSMAQAGKLALSPS